MVESTDPACSESHDLDQGQALVDTVLSFKVAR